MLESKENVSIWKNVEFSVGKMCYSADEVTLTVFSYPDV